MFLSCSILDLQNLQEKHSLCLVLLLLFETILLSHRTVKRNNWNYSISNISKFFIVLSLFHLMKYNFGNCLPDHEYLRTQLQELILAVHLILLIRSRKPYHIVSKMMKCNVKISRCSPSLAQNIFLFFIS